MALDHVEASISTALGFTRDLHSEAPRVSMSHRRDEAGVRALGDTPTVSSSLLGDVIEQRCTHKGAHHSKKLAIRH